MIGDKDFHFACWETLFLSLPDSDQEAFYSLAYFLFCHWITSLHLFYVQKPVLLKKLQPILLETNLPHSHETVFIYLFLPNPHK